MSDEPMKVIAEYDDEAELEAALAVLNDAGIKVLTSRDQASASLFGQTPYELAQVAVPENRADEALRLLSEVKPSLSSEADDEGEKEKSGYEVTEVIAKFTAEEEAQAALAALKAAGVQAVLSGHVPSAAAFSLFGRLQYAPIQLAVPQSQVDQARQVLEGAGSKPAPGWEEAAEQAIDGWLCHNCDTVVAETEQVCPECGTPRSEQPPEAAQTDED
jgi:hypothetical protein